MDPNAHHARDFVGYGRNPPQPRWPGGARLALNFCINYEEGSEPSILDGDPESEAGLTEGGAGGFTGRDLAAESMFEYGSRVGFWRVTRLLAERGMTATVLGCALALERNSEVPAAIRELGYDVCSHGWRWERHQLLSEDEERLRIRRAVESLTRTMGERPVGWYCRYGAGVNTRRLLVEEGGFLYDSDAYDDDLPYAVDVAGRRHLVLPYAFDTNDMRFFDSHAYVRGSDFADYAIDAFDALLAESREAPRMLSIGLHTRIIGRPGRIEGLHQLMRHIAQRGGAWCATREQIARHWLSHMPPENAA